MAIMQKHYPVGVAQAQVLAALGREAANFDEANAIFDELGLLVTSKRLGRSSVPVVRVLDRCDGGFLNGDGDAWTRYPTVDLTPLRQWIAAASAVATSGMPT